VLSYFSLLLPPSLTPYLTRPRDDLTYLYVPNEYMWQVCQKYPDVFLPCISVHPYRHDAQDELGPCYTIYGIFGSDASALSRRRREMGAAGSAVGEVATKLAGNRSHASYASAHASVRAALRNSLMMCSQMQAFLRGHETLGNGAAVSRGPRTQRLLTSHGPRAWKPASPPHVRL
jgi:hypothetical protein